MYFIQENAFENVVCEMAFSCLGLNELTDMAGFGSVQWGDQGV